MIIYNASAFHRRLVEPVERFPLLLLRLDCGIPSVVKEIATELLNAPFLPITARKVRDLFKVEVTELSRTGVLKNDGLGSLIRGLTMFSTADVRDSERTNKAIKLQETRSPNIGCDLLSSRVCLKHFLGQQGEGAGLQGKRWSLFRPVAEKLKNTCLAGWEAKDEVMSNPERWSPPLAPANLPSLESVKQDTPDLH